MTETAGLTVEAALEDTTTPPLTPPEPEVEPTPTEVTEPAQSEAEYYYRWLNDLTSAISEASGIPLGEGSTWEDVETTAKQLGQRLRAIRAQRDEARFLARQMHERLTECDPLFDMVLITTLPEWVAEPLDSQVARHTELSTAKRRWWRRR